MTREQAVAWMKVLGIKVVPYAKRAGWVIGACPLAFWKHDGGKSGDEVFGIKLEVGVGDSACNCFSCGWHGKQTDLLTEMRYLNKVNEHKAYNFKDAFEMVSQAEEESFSEMPGLYAPNFEELLQADNVPHEFPEWWLNSFQAWDEVKFARDYLSERNVPEEVANALDLRVDTHENRICFPVRDFAGRLMGLHGRAVDPKAALRYRFYLQSGNKNPLVWLGEHWIDLDKPILVVEGPFDLTSVIRVYRNVCSPLWANPSFAKLKRMSDAQEVFTLLDHGTGGDKGRARIKETYTDSIIYNLKPPPHRKDAGDMSVEELYELLAPYLPIDDIIQ